MFVLVRDNEEWFSWRNEHWNCKDRRLEFSIWSHRWQVRPKDLRSNPESSHWKMKYRQSSGRCIMEVGPSLELISIWIPSTLFWRLYRPDLYHDLFVRWARWCRWLKTTESMCISVSISYRNSTFTTKKFGFWTITTPRKREAVNLVNLSESTEINWFKWDKTFLNGSVILGAYSRSDAFWRC